jgi:hypothetical protein
MAANYGDDGSQHDPSLGGGVDDGNGSHHNMYASPTAASSVGSGSVGGGIRSEIGRQQYVATMKGFWQKQLEIIESNTYPPSFPRWSPFACLALVTFFSSCQ